MDESAPFFRCRPTTVDGGSAFTDVDSDAYYVEPVNWAVKYGITAGVGNGRFIPDNTCTRAQIVTFLEKDSGKEGRAFLR